MTRFRQMTMLVALACVALFLMGWGSVGHRIVSGASTLHLPPGMSHFIAKRAWLEDSSSVPDWRRSGTHGYHADDSEGPKHFMDIDDYPEHTTRSVPNNLNTLIAQYGSSRVYDNGISPWAILAACESLKVQMQRGAWNAAWSSAADLGHYVGDAHQPLHNTVRFNGSSAYPGSSGLHSRYESGMISRFQSDISVTSEPATYIGDVQSYVFDFVYDAQGLVDSLYRCDERARTKSGWGGSSSSAPNGYLDALWSESKALTTAQFQRASRSLADLMYTAWIDAGSPTPGGATFVNEPSGAAPSSIDILSSYPNPFNPSTTISFQVDRPGSVHIEVFDLRGRSVGTIAQGEFASGTYRFPFDAGSKGLASGIYLVHAVAVNSNGVRSEFEKIVLLK